MYFIGLIHRERLVVKMNLKYNCRKVKHSCSSMQNILICFTTYLIKYAVKHIISWGGEVNGVNMNYQKD